MLTLGRTIFCSDFHLHRPPDSHPQARDFFLSAHERADSLVVLGDLFESWWGDDHNELHYQEWENFFCSLKLPHYLLLGNRDFLIGKDFYQRSGFIPLESGTLVQIGSLTIGLLHGDEPGLQDYWYQVWRKIVRAPLAQRLFLSLPEPWRQKCAHKLREKKSRKDLDPQELSFTPLSIDCLQWLCLFPRRPEILIHGHLHHPVVEELSNGVVRYQLGCWDSPNTSWISIDPSGLIESEHTGPQQDFYRVIQDELLPESESLDSALAAAQAKV